MQEQKVEESLMELRTLNAMQYLRPSNGCLTERRTLKSSNFTNASYGWGQTMSWISQSGGDAVWGPSSFLRLEYDNDATADADWGVAGVLAICRNARLTHSSGEQLEYISNVNLLASERLKYETSRDDYDKIKGMLRIGTTEAKSTTQVAIIPLSYLFGLFDNQEQYIPPSFLGGAKIEIDLMSKVGGTTTGTAVLTFKPTIVLDSCQLYDAVQKQLLDEQSDTENSGLQFHYKTFFNTQATVAVQSINFDVQQSASLACRAFACVRHSDQVEVGGKDNNNFQPAVLSYQYRLGSAYFPQQIIRNPSFKVQTESYALALQSVGAIPHQYVAKQVKDAGISYAEYTDESKGSAKDVEGRVPVYATSLEMSANGLALSGSSTNNSRLLNFSAQLDDPSAGKSWNVNVFLEYVRLANIMHNNLIVDR